MIIIGEKINGAIPAVGRAIAERDDSVIRARVRAQAAAGADYIDCAPGTETSLEYDAMCWLVDIIQQETDVPVCIDSPDASLLARIITEGRLLRPGMVNSVNEEGTKCETIFPIIAGTEWNVVGLTCDREGIPSDPEKRIAIAASMIEKADKFGVDLPKLHIDPCVMALATRSSAQEDFVRCIRGIHDLAPAVKVTGAISNISFEMPARKYVNMGCMTAAVAAGLDSAIMDPTSQDMMGALYAAEALAGIDKGGRKYNRAYRKGLFGQKNSK